MTYNGFKYNAKTMNRSGYTVMLPNVGEGSDLMSGITPDPYAISSTQLFPLGTKLIQAERVWRYSLNGAAALVPGFTCQSAASAGAEHDVDMVTAAASVGDFEVTITPTSSVSMTANQYKEGYLWFNDETGKGQCMKVKSHPAITHNETGIITLYDPITLAIDSSTQTGIVKNPYSGVVITPDTTLTGMVVGICDIPVTIANYFWLQTGGPCSVNVIGTLVLGGSATGDTSAGTVDGSVGPFATVGTEQNIGSVMKIGATTEKALIFLTLDR